VQGSIVGSKEDADDTRVGQTCYEKYGGAFQLGNSEDQSPE
jgi:hypothetical protein